MCHIILDKRKKDIQESFEQEKSIYFVQRFEMIISALSW